jgi:hypothetical protein
LTAFLLLLVLTAGAWRFRSWLMGVFENVEVLGKSGADLETELLHHQASPEDEGPVGGKSAADGPESAGGQTLQQPTG